MTDRPDDPVGDESPPLAPGEYDQVASDHHQRPVMPAQGEPELRSSGGFASTVSAFLGMSFICLLVFFCSGANLHLVALVIGIFLFALLHYVLWGWWLGAAIRRQVQQEEDEQG